MRFPQSSLSKDSWAKDNTWDKTFLSYSIIVIVSQVILVSYAVYQLFVTFNAKDDVWVKWSVVTYMLFGISIAGLSFAFLYFPQFFTVRIIEFAVDPHGVRQILPSLLELFMFNLPLITWICCGFMLFLYW